MKKTLRLIENWKDVEFESSTVKTDQFKKFARDFRASIKEQVSGVFEIESYFVGHFYVSGFLRSPDGENIYFSISDVRHFSNEWINKILIRTAKNNKDFSGGRNNFTTILEFAENAKRLI